MRVGLGSMLRHLARRSIRGELAWVTAGQAAGFLGSVAGVAVLTKRMSASGYGELGLGVTLAGLAFMVVFNPLQNALMRFYSVFRDRGAVPTYYRLYRRVFLWGSGGVVALAAAFWAFSRVAWGGRWAPIALAASALGIANGYFFFHLGLHNALRRRAEVAIHMGLEPWLKIGLALACLALFGDSGAAALAGYCLADICLSGSLRFWAVRSAPIRQPWRESFAAPVERAELDEVLRYVLPYGGIAIATALSLYGDRWVLQGTFGARELGIYTALNQVAAAPGGLASGVISAFLVPIIFERAGDVGDLEKVKGSLRLTLAMTGVSALVFLPFLLVFYLFGGTILRVLTAPIYAEHQALLWLLGLGALAGQVGQSLSLFGQVYRRNERFVVPWTLNAVATIALSLWLGRAYGLIGFSAALLISNLLFALASGVIAWRLILEAREAVLSAAVPTTAG